MGKGFQERKQNVGIWMLLFSCYHYSVPFLHKHALFFLSENMIGLFQFNKKKLKKTHIQPWLV